MTACQDYQKNVLDLIERCAPSSGVFDIDVWESLGRPPVTRAEAAPAILPESQRTEKGLTLEERIETGNWAFASTPGGSESLEASHSAVDALGQWGMLESLPSKAKQDWVAYINQYQDSDTGYFLGPYVRECSHPSWLDRDYVTHPWGHMHDHLICVLVPTLLMLGGAPRYKLSECGMTGRFLDRQTLREYLWGRTWREYPMDLNFRDHNPWYLGNEYWYPGCFLWLIWRLERGTPAGDRARVLLDEEWYRWHDENMSPWGLWYGDLNGETKRLYTAPLGEGEIPEGGLPRNDGEWYWHSMQVMGGAHQLWLYDHDNHFIAPEIRAAQTDLLLAMQNTNDHHFGIVPPHAPKANSNDCTDVDCLTLLSYNFHRLDYRRDDIRVCCERSAKAILRNKIDAHGVLSTWRDRRAWSHHHASYETLSPANAPSLHQQGFYLWALLAAVSVLSESDDPAIQSFIDYPWPTMPSYWLWIPGWIR